MKTLSKSSSSVALHPWRPLFWEPVSGTGERLMAGVVFCYDGQWEAVRIIRDDVLAALYGQDAANGAINLIEFGLKLFGEAAKSAASLERLGVSISGLYAGEERTTEAQSRAELLRTAALLYSSLANLDKFDSAQEQDIPLSEEVTKRFSTEIRDLVVRNHPNLEDYFGRHAVLFSGGDKVRFGFVSPRAALHFNVVTPIRPGPSLRDARARIFELQRCREITGIDKAVLISAVPRSDDPTLGVRQRQNIQLLNEEIAGEARSVNVGYIPVTSASAGAEQVVLLGA